MLLLLLTPRLPSGASSVPLTRGHLLLLLQLFSKVSTASEGSICSTIRFLSLLLLLLSDFASLIKSSVVLLLLLLASRLLPPATSASPTLQPSRSSCVLLHLLLASWGTPLDAALMSHLVLLLSLLRLAAAAVSAAAVLMAVLCCSFVSVTFLLPLLLELILPLPAALEASAGLLPAGALLLLSSAWSCRLC